MWRLPMGSLHIFYLARVWLTSDLSQSLASSSHMAVSDFPAGGECQDAPNRNQPQARNAG